MSKSRIWIKPPLYLKLFMWVLWTANHTKIETGNHVYKRGELVTTYHEIIKAMCYYQNRKHIIPSLKQIRGILAWLKSEGMIEIHPLRTSELPNKGRPSVCTGAYIGIKIIVVNYDTYQNSENYKGRHKGRPSSSQGHNNNNEQEEKNIYVLHHGDQKVPVEDALSEILSLLNKKRTEIIGHNGIRPITSDKQIRARLNDGGTVHECCRIILTKAKDPFFAENPRYFHPDTLFRKGHWNKYLDEAELLKDEQDIKRT